MEVDGEHHLTGEGKAYDAARDKFLAEQGYEVLRIPGYRVTQEPAAVLRQIELAIDDRLDAVGAISSAPFGIGKHHDTTHGMEFGFVPCCQGPRNEPNRGLLTCGEHPVRSLSASAGNDAGYFSIVNNWICPRLFAGPWEDYVSS